MTMLTIQEAGGFQALEDLLFLVLVQHADIDPGIAQIVGGRPGGDTVGSAAALCAGLRALGSAVIGPSSARMS